MVQNTLSTPPPPPPRPKKKKQKEKKKKKKKKEKKSSASCIQRYHFHNLVFKLTSLCFFIQTLSIIPVNYYALKC